MWLTLVLNQLKGHVRRRDWLKGTWFGRVARNLFALKIFEKLSHKPRK